MSASAGRDPDAHPLNNWQRYKNRINIPNHVKQALNCWLQKWKADQLERGRGERKSKGALGHFA